MSFEPLDPGEHGASVDEAEGADEVPLGRSRRGRWLFALVACLLVAALILSVLPSGGSLDPTR